VLRSILSLYGRKRPLELFSSQAVPLFFAKFSKLINFLRGSVREGTLLAAVNKYILVRDTVFFVVDFFHGGSCFGLRAPAGQSSIQVEGSKGIFAKIDPD